MIELAKPVLTPLPNIATHIIDSKFVWLFRLHLVSLLVTIIFVPCNFFNIVDDDNSKIKPYNVVVAEFQQKFNDSLTKKLQF